MILIDFIGWVLVWLVTLGGYDVRLHITVNGEPRTYKLLPRLW